MRSLTLIGAPHPLTGADLAVMLDRLHAQTIKVFAESGSFNAGRAGLTFANLLEQHASGPEIADLLEWEPGDPQADSGNCC